MSCYVLMLLILIAASSSSPCVHWSCCSSSTCRSSKTHNATPHPTSPVLPQNSALAHLCHKVVPEIGPLAPPHCNSVNWKVVGTSCKLKSCKGVFGVQPARSEDSTVLTTETSQESSFVNVILFLMFAFRLLRCFARWFGAEWPKSILQAGYFAVTLAKSNMQEMSQPLSNSH